MAKTADLVRRMLYDAVAWQESYADSVTDTDLYKDAMADLRRYRAYVKRRYGSARTPLEQEMDEATPMSLEEIRSLPS
jgi:hypothetical protein